jgi:hypothetical protein
MLFDAEDAYAQNIAQLLTNRTALPVIYRVFYFKINILKSHAAS